MSKLFKKSLAFCVAIAMVFTLFAGTISVNAEDAEETLTVNLVVDNTRVAADAAQAVLPVHVTCSADTSINVLRLVITTTAGKVSNVVSAAATEDYTIYYNGDYALLNAGQTVEDLGGFNAAELLVTVDLNEGLTEEAYAITIDARSENASDANENALKISYETAYILLPHTHTMSETYSYDDNGHWLACTSEFCDVVGGYTTEVAEHVWENNGDAVAPDCVDTLEQPVICNICGATKTVNVDPVGHDYEYTNNGETHSAVCKNNAEHVITDEAHTYVDGTCACGAEEVVVEECKHVHNSAPISATPAQEDGTKGSIVFYCELCHKDIAYDVEYRRASSSPENPSMVLGATTRMNVTLRQSNAGTKCYFTYTHNYVNGAEPTFSAFSVNDAVLDGNNYKWSIPAYYSQFTDEFVSAMFTYYDGKWTNGLTRVFTVKKAAMAYITPPTGTSSGQVDIYTKRVAANLLKAGDATLEEFYKELYKSLPDEKRPASDLVGDYAQYVTQDIPSLEKNETNWIVNQANASVDGMCGFASPNVKLGELIKVKLTINPKYYPNFKENGNAALSNMKLKYSYTAYNGVDVPPAYITDVNILADGKMEFELNTLATTNLRCPIKFQLFDGDTAASYEVTYSVEAILAQIYNSYPKTIAAVMNYSDSVVDRQNNL